jgi:hypothetical protein
VAVETGPRQDVLQFLRGLDPGGDRWIAAAERNQLAENREEHQSDENFTALYGHGRDLSSSVQAQSLPKILTLFTNQVCLSVFHVSGNDNLMILKMERLKW